MSHFLHTSFFKRFFSVEQVKMVWIICRLLIYSEISGEHLLLFFQCRQRVIYCDVINVVLFFVIDIAYLSLFNICSFATFFLFFHAICYPASGFEPTTSQLLVRIISQPLDHDSSLIKKRTCDVIDVICLSLLSLFVEKTFSLIKDDV